MANRPSDDALGKAVEGCMNASFQILKQMRHSPNRNVRIAGYVITAGLVLAFVIFVIWVINHFSS